MEVEGIHTSEPDRRTQALRDFSSPPSSGATPSPGAFPRPGPALDCRDTEEAAPAQPSSAGSGGGERLADSLDVFDVVDPSLLLPPDPGLRGSWRLDAAVALDRELLVLAGMKAHGRLVQAKLTRRLMDVRGWKDLGFVRLSDYARERLGIAPRSLEDDARVLRACDDLPRLRTALESRVITWTQARLLVRVATPRNEEQLLERAASLRTRALEEYLRTVGGNAAAAPESGAEATSRTGASAAAPEDGAYTTLRTAESAAAPNGDADLSQARSDPPQIETPKSPGMSGDLSDADEPGIRWTIPLSHCGRRLWRTACEIASRCAGSPLSPGQVLELVAAEAASGGPRAATPADAWAPSMQELEERLRAGQRRDEARGRRALQAFLAEAGVVDGFAWLAPGGRDAGPATLLDRLLEGVDAAQPFALDRRLRELRLAMQRIDFQMGALLRIGSDRRLFRELGFATRKLYVESRLGCSSRTATSLIAIERETWRCRGELREAWREGRISHLAACTILPVLGEQSAAAWIRRAGEVTLRRLADEVAWALDHGERTWPLGRPAPPPLDADIRQDGVADVGDDEVRMRAHDAATETDGFRPSGAVRLAFDVPVSVAALVEWTLRHHRQDGEARWRTFERIVALALLEWTSAPRHRDPVFERDGWRCSVPGCSSRRNLQDHHVVFRSHGGGNARDNRTTVCAAHHLHGIHAGIVRAEGRAPDGIVWELGCRRGERPLMRLLGDRVLSGCAFSASWSR